MKHTGRLAAALTALALSLLIVNTADGADAAGGSLAHDCARPGTLFCEDFERLPVGGASSLDWGIDTRNGTLTVERRGTGPSSRRGKVLHVRTVDNGRAFLRVDDLVVPPAGFYGRMRLRVNAFPTAPDWAHFTLVEATGTGSTEVVRPVGGQYVPTEKRNFYGVGSDLGPTGDWTAWKTTAPATAGKWQCVEFHLDATDNRVTVYFDGVLRPDLTVSTDRHGGTTDPFVFPTFDKLKLGWQLYQADPSPSSYDVRMDDIALSTRRIGGCAA